ncbi:hypothetical protein BLOT_011022 [Blomia tropicalis]|nr:hypothetical protein BLOT_011022 [Blomia tropicalis]
MDKNNNKYESGSAPSAGEMSEINRINRQRRRDGFNEVLYAPGIQGVAKVKEAIENLGTKKEPSLTYKQKMQFNKQNRQKCRNGGGPVLYAPGKKDVAEVEKAIDELGKKKFSQNLCQFTIIDALIFRVVVDCITMTNGQLTTDYR